MLSGTSFPGLSWNSLTSFLKSGVPVRKSRSNPCFIELAARDLAQPDEIEGYIEWWHSNHWFGETLHSFLGMSLVEYNDWIQDPESIHAVIQQWRQILIEEGDL